MVYDLPHDTTWPAPAPKLHIHRRHRKRTKLSHYWITSVYRQMSSSASWGRKHSLTISCSKRARCFAISIQKQLRCCIKLLSQVMVISSGCMAWLAYLNHVIKVNIKQRTQYCIPRHKTQDGHIQSNDFSDSFSFLTNLTRRRARLPAVHARTSSLREN